MSEIRICSTPPLQTSQRMLLLQATTAKDKQLRGSFERARGGDEAFGTWKNSLPLLERKAIARFFSRLSTAVVISEAIQVLINTTKQGSLGLQWLLSPTPRLSHSALRSSKSEGSGTEVVFAGIRQMQVARSVNYGTVGMQELLKDLSIFQ